MTTIFEDALVSGIMDSNIAMVTGYPGYPITGIFEKIIKRSQKECPEFPVGWCVNEVVAVGKAIGVCLLGARSVVLMKNHGMNTIQDALINLSYIGSRAGILIISADDIGVHASHNESDSRQYGPLNMVPVIEPATVGDAYNFISYGLNLSENCNTPVILRISSNQLGSIGELEAESHWQLPYHKNYDFNLDGKRYFIGPNYYYEMKAAMIERVEKIKSLQKTKFNKLIVGNRDFGIICSGNCYNKAIKLFPYATILKIGLSYPLIKNDLEHFFSLLFGSEKIWILEETEQIIECQVKEYLYNNAKSHPGFQSLNIIGKDEFPKVGEISEVELLAKCANNKHFANLRTREKMYFDEPTKGIRLCPACPARAILISLKLIGVKTIGDAGCTALGCFYPFESVHCTICMGSSISIAAGINQLAEKKVVALIGDSAFFHSGILALFNEANSKTELFTILFNNRTAGMTGRQTTLNGIQNAEDSSEKIREILWGAGIPKENVKVLRDSLDVAKVKREVNRFYHILKGNRVLIIEGRCPYNLHDFLTIDAIKSDCVKVIKGEMMNPGCFAYEKVNDYTHKLYRQYCGPCNICKELIKHTANRI